MKEIIAIHGWAGDSTEWSNWETIFQCSNWKWQSADRGYKKISQNTPRWSQNLNQSQLIRVVICHSLGSHFIDKEVLNSATNIVLINSFSRFIPSGKESRSVTMALNNMLSAINTPKEASMLRKFYLKSHKPNESNVILNDSHFLSISDSGRRQLKNDLKFLINSNSLPTGLDANAKVLVINSEKDFILTIPTKEKLVKDLIGYLETPPIIMNLKEEGHSISKTKNIKKIKHWLESNYAKNMVEPS